MKTIEEVLHWIEVKTRKEKKSGSHTHAQMAMSLYTIHILDELKQFILEGSDEPSRN
jgi:hypothetical protein